MQTVALEEKAMYGSVFSCLSPSSSSSPSSPPSSLWLLLHHFVLETKAKWVKVGMRRMEGWAMKVLRMPRCQQETSPRRKPGRKLVANAAAIPGNCSAAATEETSANPFPRREERQAAKMSRNLQTTGRSKKSELSKGKLWSNLWRSEKYEN